MAALALPAPGTELGPCLPDSSIGFVRTCGHVDCAASRRTADAVCRLCGAPIGYERRYYVDPEGEASLFQFVHASCLEAQA